MAPDIILMAAFSWTYILFSELFNHTGAQCSAIEYAKVNVRDEVQSLLTVEMSADFYFLLSRVLSTAVCLV